MHELEFVFPPVTIFLSQIYKIKNRKHASKHIAQNTTQEILIIYRVPSNSFSLKTGVPAQLPPWTVR